MRVLSAIAAAFGFLYEALNLGPSLIGKVFQQGGTANRNIVSLAGLDYWSKFGPRPCNLLFLNRVKFRPRTPISMRMRL